MKAALESDRPEQSRLDRTPIQRRASCIYEGRVMHRRASPVPHAFDYSVFMMYFDLEELPKLFAGRWMWSSDRFALAHWHRADAELTPDQIADRFLSTFVNGLKPR